MLSYQRSIFDTDEPLRRRRSPAYLNSRLDPKRYGAVFYRCARAAHYFQKALSNNPGPELATRAYYMLAECDRRSRWMDMRRQSGYEGGEGGVTSPMFRTWAKRYKNTQVYQAALEACPDLRDYLGGEEQIGALSAIPGVFSKECAIKYGYELLHVFKFWAIHPKG